MKCYLMGVSSFLLSCFTLTFSFELIRSQQISQSIQRIRENMIPKFDIPEIRNTLERLSNGNLVDTSSFLAKNDLSSVYADAKVYLSILQVAAETTCTKYISVFTELTGIQITIPIEVIDAVAIQGFALLSVMLLTAVAQLGRNGRNDEAPYDVGTSTYNVKKADEFYGQKPFLVAHRLFRLAYLTSAFNVKLLLDWRLGNLERNEKERAKEALTLSSQLGPTFIKLGQALSIRTDLIPEAYALELRQLQDAVPPFDSTEAKEIIRKSFRVSDLKQLFSKISDKPIASASIGQVYKATMKDGRDVAIKVQRPSILAEIALDLYILRLLSPLQVKVSNLINRRSTSQADIDVALSLVDEWGRGFVAEVDYRTEAFNTKKFIDAMNMRELDAVTAPKVVDELSNEVVITTEWMDGTRLDRDASSDVPRLCSIAVNAYLTMLLDTGVLHCDPHPGNLLRTTDGKLCVLDWGMTLQVPPNLQYSILEFIAHVISEDYDAMPADFINLGFSPDDKLAQLKKSGLTEGLSFALRQLRRGGGAKKIQERFKNEFKSRYGENLTDDELRLKAREEMIERMSTQLKSEGVDVKDVTGVMEEMSRRNRELFKLPPYVLYVSRAFSTLEGIGLSINDEYSILQECYPYLAKRLFTDNSPRAQEALRSMLYGAGEAKVFSPAKLLEMSDGFSSYTSATGSADDQRGSELARKALIDFLVSEKGNFVQDTILEETTKLIDATFRDTFQKARSSPVGLLLRSSIEAQMRLADSVSNVPFFGKAISTPVRFPSEVLSSLSVLFEKDDADETTLKLASAIFDQINSKADSGKSVPSVADIQKWLLEPDSILRKTLVDLDLRSNFFPRAGAISSRFGAKLLHRASTRIEKSLIGHFQNSEGSLKSDTIFDGSSVRNKDEQIVLASNGKATVKNIASLVASSARYIAENLVNQ